MMASVDIGIYSTLVPEIKQVFVLVTYVMRSPNTVGFMDFKVLVRYILCAFVRSAMHMHVLCNSVIMNGIRLKGKGHP